MTFDYKEDWCNDCLYVNDKNECMCIKHCHKGSQKVIYSEENFKAGRQIMLAKEQIKKGVK